jgi:hypothetical protein
MRAIDGADAVSIPLLVGYYERGKLRYAGKVGTGFAVVGWDGVSSFAELQNVLSHE